VEVDSGAAQVVFEEDYWIGHVNTSPTQPDILTFCHEGPWDQVDNRIWGLNAGTGTVWKIRPTAEGEVVGHEYWFADGIHIGYHGHTAEGKPMLGRIRYDNTMPREHDFIGQTGHIFSLDDKLIVGDGSGVIRVWKKEGDGYSQPRVLCRHDSAMRIQQTHPHPRISPDGSYVVFSSDRSGYCNVYMVPVVEYESLPPAEG
jgi:oligogalacturonide lyase